MAPCEFRRRSPSFITSHFSAPGLHCKRLPPIDTFSYLVTVCHSQVQHRLYGSWYHAFPVCGLWSNELPPLPDCSWTTGEDNRTMSLDPQTQRAALIPTWYLTKRGEGVLPEMW